MVRAIVTWGAIALSLLLIGASLAWLWAERGWSAWAPQGSAAEQEYHAFTRGPIGLETFPLKYAAVIGTVSGAAFRPDPADTRSVWEIYGFLANPRSTGAPLCAANAADELPYGFNVTNYLPERAAQTPVTFAGLTCASCHSGRIRKGDGTLGPIIDGMGNPELDVIAFSEAVRGAILDPSLTAERILDAYAAQCADDAPGLVGGLIEQVLIAGWLDGFRAAVADGVGRYDLPVPPAALKTAEGVAAGPGRTRPFRSVVRTTLELPGIENYAFSKIPAVFEQRTDLRPRSQFDGSIADPVVRSFIAAYASGATPLALSKPEVAHTVRAAAAYTETLGIATPLPRFVDTFPDAAPAPDAVTAGFDAYRSACGTCHGHRDPATGAWVAEGAQLHRFLPVDEIGTDPERVRFPHGPLLPLSLWTALPGWGTELAAQQARLEGAKTAALAANRPAEAWLWQAQADRLARSARRFRLGHPLAFPECTGATCACAAEQGAPGRETCTLTAELAYFTNPIPSVWLRAPYLHNGAVPTLRQLLNLDDRPARFCRGANPYDPVGIGYTAPAPGLTGCPAAMPFVFDTAARGNSNAGHDYPFTRDEIMADPGKAAQAEAILAYLKSF